MNWHFFYLRYFHLVAHKTCLTFTLDFMRYQLEKEIITITRRGKITWRIECLIFTLDFMRYQLVKEIITITR